MKIPVSIIVPFLNESRSLRSLIDDLADQTAQFEEAIFVDSGSVDQSESIIEKYVNDRFEFRVIKNEGKLRFPGESRNLGVQASRSDFVAFMDVGLNVYRVWLETISKGIVDLQLEGKICRCLFFASNTVGVATCALSTGVGKSTSSLPGSIFHKKIFEKTGYFPTTLRSAEDLLWRSRFREKYTESVVEKPLIEYTSFPTNLMSVSRKWFIYSISSFSSGLYFRQAYVYMFGFAAWGITLYQLRFFILFTLFYIFTRGVLDPVRRSASLFWWKTYPLSFLICPVVAFLMDSSKLLGFLKAIAIELYGHKRLTAN